MSRETYIGSCGQLFTQTVTPTNSPLNIRLMSMQTRYTANNSHGHIMWKVDIIGGITKCYNSEIIVILNNQWEQWKLRHLFRIILLKFCIVRYIAYTQNDILRILPELNNQIKWLVYNHHFIWNIIWINIITKKLL